MESIIGDAEDMLRPVMLTTLLFGAAAAKGPCTDYFGPVDATPNVTTVIDPDVTQGFPFAFDTFVHHSGPGSACFAPGPPAGCHRYYVVDYDLASCSATCPLADGSAKSLAGKKDTEGNFDRANGVLKACKECAVGAKMACYQAPSSEPVKCACPGADWK